MQITQLRRRIKTEVAKLGKDVSNFGTLEPIVAAATLCALVTVESASEAQDGLASVLRNHLTKEWIATGDLLSVFYALHALRQHDKTLPGDVMACAVRRLVASEVAPGGPYRSLDKTLSPEANAVIALFLADDAQLPALESYIAETIHKNMDDLGSVITGQFLYIVVPALPLGARSEVLEAIKKRLPKMIAASDPLQLALLSTVLVRLGDTATARSLVERLVQLVNGKPIVPGRLFDMALQPGVSAVLTRSIIVEALSVWVAASQPKVVSSASGYHQKVLERVKKKLARLPSPLNESGLRAWEQVLRADKNHEIALMPRFFAEVLIPNKAISDELLAQLGEASFFCWIATIIYDDFIDEEGEPAMLPIANVANRISLGIYRKLLADYPGQYDYVEQMCDRVDRANAWELAHARAKVDGKDITLPELPHFGTRTILADRAFGHAISPMLVAMRVPGAKESQILQLHKALQQYLIARQINDDLHDWRDDLKVGQLSSVLTDLLRATGVTPGVYDLDALIAQLEVQFFQHGLKEAGQQLLLRVARCRRALALSGLVGQPGGFGRLLDDMEASAHEALQIQANQETFLRSYEAE